MLLLHVKVYKSNFFLILSSGSGQVLWIKNSGSLGFKNIQKRGVEALMCLLESALNKIIFIKEPYLFLKLEGITIPNSKLINKHFIILCKKNNIIVIGLQHVNKIVHNGCRAKK